MPQAVSGGQKGANLQIAEILSQINVRDDSFRFAVGPLLEFLVDPPKVKNSIRLYFEFKKSGFTKGVYKAVDSEIGKPDSAGAWVINPWQHRPLLRTSQAWCRVVAKWLRKMFLVAAI